MTAWQAVGKVACTRVWEWRALVPGPESYLAAPPDGGVRKPSRRHPRPSSWASGVSVGRQTLPGQK